MSAQNEKAPALGRAQGLGDGERQAYCGRRRGVPCWGHHAKLGRDDGTAPARRILPPAPARGQSVLLLPVCSRGRSIHILEIGDMTTTTPRAPGAHLPKPATGPLVYPVKFYLSEGEHACLYALAQRLGCPLEGAAAALLCSELRRQYAAASAPAATIPDGRFPLFPQSRGAVRHG